MAICPRGHESIDVTFCDVCGRPIAQESSPAELCPMCRTSRNGNARFCEACRFDFATVSTPIGPAYAAPQPEPPSAYNPGDQPGYAYPEPVYPDQSSRSVPSQTTYDVPGTAYPYPPADPQTYAPTDPGYTDPSYNDPSYRDDGFNHGTVIGPGPVVVPPPPPGPPQHQPQYVWTLQVTADEGYFNRVVAQGGPDAHAMRFPPYPVAWEVALHGDVIRVGRRRSGEGASGRHEIDIDLSGPPSDPGISHLHIVLMRGPDGGLQLVDPGSTNGTTINDGEEAIEINVPVPLRDGDRVHVGAWTTLEVRLTAVQ
ncbi:FHA domain-containing protein [Yinghuangia sp. YIM S10712]|uniref:FHA domain-containing protein n=1 Tax=Yinghuangia sp. YIM S10712 TaxID=3436930 RepID=UPI003F5379C3